MLEYHGPFKEANQLQKASYESKELKEICVPNEYNIKDIPRITGHPITVIEYINKKKCSLVLMNIYFNLNPYH